MFLTQLRPDAIARLGHGVFTGFVHQRDLRNDELLRVAAIVNGERVENVVDLLPFDGVAVRFGKAVAREFRNQLLLVVDVVMLRDE